MPNRSSGENTSPKGFRVLVVDEQVPSAELICSLLEPQGHEVRIALDALDTMRIALEFAPHIVFIATRLASKNDCELPRALRSLHETRHCKFILLTDGVQSPHRSELKRVGLSHFLEPPISLESLLGAIDGANSPPILLS